MKNTRTFILLGLLSIGLISVAQNDTTKTNNNIIKVGALTGNLGLQYERALSQKISLVGQFGYLKLDGIVYEQTKGNVFGTYLEARYYFSAGKGKMRGWHIGPYFQDLRFHLKQTNFWGYGDDFFVNGKASIAGITSGYQWRFNSNLTMEAIFGIGIAKFKITDNGYWGSEQTTNTLTPAPNLGITIGYAF